MSSFIVLTFDSKQDKEEARHIANDFKIDLYDEGYGVDPHIKKPHLFFEDPAASSIINCAIQYYKTGSKTFDEIFSYLEAEPLVEREGVIALKKRKDYKDIKERYFKQLKPLEAKQEEWIRKLEVYYETGDYDSQEYFDCATKYNEIGTEIGQLISQQEKYFSLSLRYDYEDRKMFFETDIRSLKECSAEYPKFKDFIKQVVDKSGKIEILWHNSDHSENEYIPVKEEREIKFKDITIETFAFLPSNVLLRIIK